MVSVNLNNLSTNSLRLLEEELEQKFQDMPEYQDLILIKRLLAERQGGPVEVQRAVVTPTTINRNPYSPRIVRLGRITAIGAAIKALEAAGRPLSIHELVEAVPKYGFEIKTTNAKRPASRLATYLNKRSGDGPLVSIWVDNKPMWWFRDRPVPGAEVA